MTRRVSEVLILAKNRSRNKWRKLPACDPLLSRKLEAHATDKPDTYFTNDPYAFWSCTAQSRRDAGR